MKTEIVLSEDELIILLEQARKCTQKCVIFRTKTLVKGVPQMQQLAKTTIC